MVELSMSEAGMVKVLSMRLSMIASAVVRSQLLMQFSQLIDMAYLGDTDKERRSKMVSEIDELIERLSKYEDVDE